ncbi:hypothetical protein D3C80_1650550 [compost metagenome]
MPLAHQNAENVGEVLVQCAGLAVVGQVAGEGLHAMGQFVADDLQRAGEALRPQPGAIAIGHLRAVPIGVVHGHVGLGAVVKPFHVHGGDQAHAIAVQGVALEQLLIKVVGNT